MEKCVLAVGADRGVCVSYTVGLSNHTAFSGTCQARNSQATKGQSIRIAHISDLLCDAQKRLEDRLPTAISEQHPDMIVFTGDAINSREALRIFANA